MTLRLLSYVLLLHIWMLISVSARIVKKKAHAQEFITYELAFELFILQSRSDELVLSAFQRHRHS